MKTVVLRNLQIGKGMPKVIVPIAESRRGDILAMGGKLAAMGPDAVEWRADYFESIMDEGAVTDTLGELRRILGDMPLIFTCRTVKEGGRADILDEAYAGLCRAVARSGYADGIDIEVLSHGGHGAALIQDMRGSGLVTIGSCHIPDHTPGRETLANIFREIHDAGADIPKLAVMAQSPEDTLALMAAAMDAKKRGISPFIAIAMGEHGMASRITGELLGSAAAFAAVGKGSAPGQLSLGAMREILKKVHDNI